MVISIDAQKACNKTTNPFILLLKCGNVTKKAFTEVCLKVKVGILSP